MTLITWPISAEDSPSLDTVALVVSATLTAVVATLAASVAFLAISLMLAPISSAPVATVWRFWLTCTVAPETTLVWAEVSSALALICWLTVVRCSDAVARFSALSPMLLNALAQIGEEFSQPFSHLPDGIAAAVLRSPG